MTQSVFADIKDRSFPYVYHGTILVGTLVGGVPSNENVARGWLETKLKGTSQENQIQKLVTETMLERGITANEALDIVNNMKNLNGFKKDRDKGGELYYEGRQLKAALREAVSVAVSVEKIRQQGWGKTKKWITGFFPEHVFVGQEKLHLGVTEPSGVLQQFVHTRFGSSIQYQEYVTDAKFNFTIVTDHLFSDHDWSMIWTTGEMNGLGASRSQGYGTYKVIEWEKDFTKAALADLKELEEAEDTEDEVVIKTKSRGKAA